MVLKIQEFQSKPQFIEVVRVTIKDLSDIAEWTGFDSFAVYSVASTNSMSRVRFFNEGEDKHSGLYAFLGSYLAKSKEGEYVSFPYMSEILEHYNKVKQTKG